MTIQTLWSRAKEILALMHMALGDPQALFDLVRPSRKQARELRAWLAPLEALVRKLLLIEAQALRTAGAPPANRINKRIAPSKEACRRGAGGPTLPTPRFVFPIQRAPIDPRICKGYGPRIMLELTRSPAFRPPRERKRHQRLCAGVRFGLRYAALIRVIENPAPFAKRLARRLMKAPALFPELIAAEFPRDTYVSPLIAQAQRVLEPPRADSS